MHEKLDKLEFEKLFKALYAPLCKYCCQLVHDTIQAEDIVQELFVYLWNQRDQIKIKKSIEAYLFAAAKNRCITYLKSKFAAFHQDTEEKVLNYSSGENPNSELENKELNNLLHAAINNLPEKCRIIFSLSRFGDLSYKVIAKKLDISERTVESQIHIAIKKIKEHLIKFNYPLIFFISVQLLIKICISF